ncbi:MAG TPA: nucleoside transporter C-terminal domain-containing protein [Myxococcota bacterium]|nr:nucleoside transporter C-terminal domain-containing protein [Myxococcota bacterium]
MNALAPRAVSALGFLCWMAVAWALSENRRAVPWATVFWGIALQLGLGLLLLKTPFGRGFFALMISLVDALLACTDAGVRFVFGALVDTGFSFAVHVLPTIVFMSSLFAVLYHVGFLQVVVRALSVVFARTMRISGAESLSAIANIFLGMVESALVVRPYLARMTRSEMFLMMTLGMATVAGSVMLAYVGMLGGGDYAGHLATASLVSAPAGVLMAKLMVPEREVAATAGGRVADVPDGAANLIDAAAQGAIAGLRLAAYVGALLVAFVALIALANGVLAWLGAAVGIADLTFQRLLGLAMAPAAWLLGVPWADAGAVGALIGEKTVLNEFLAYQDLGRQIASASLAPRSAVIASYALCGFANFGSLAIMVGGIGGLAPERRGEVVELGLRTIVSGTLASFSTACVAGMLL